MLGLVIGIEFGLARWGHGFTNPVGLEWRFGAQAAQRKAPRYEILCLGDSLLKCGVAAEVLEAKLGQRSFNLALTAATPAVTYFQLRRALEAGARPRAIVLDFVPFLLDWDPRYCAHLLPEALSLRDCADLGWTTRDAGLFGTVALARLFPSFRDRQGIRTRAQVTLLRQDTPTRLVQSDLARDAQRGAQGQTNLHLPPDHDLISFALYPPSWACSEVNASYIERTLSLADSLRIRVFWLVPPFSPAAHERRERMGLDERYTAFVRDVASRHPNLIVVDGRRAGYPDWVHADPAHLNRQGAIAFSTQVAEVIEKSLADRRRAATWIDLPTFPDRPIQDALSDERASRVTLSATATKRGR
jgi:hypothetical protein